MKMDICNYVVLQISFSLIWQTVLIMKSVARFSSYLIQMWHNDAVTGRLQPPLEIYVFWLDILCIPGVKWN